MKVSGHILVCNTQVYDRSLSWLGSDTPNTQVYDRSLSWLGNDTPDKQVYDRLHSFLGTGLATVPLANKYMTAYFPGLVQAW
jgi:hypothetical protein